MAIKLLDQFRNAMRACHYSVRTEQAYLFWAERYIRFHGIRHPAEMGDREVVQFLTDLAITHDVSASTQSQALNALSFLYKHVTGRPMGDVGQAVRARRSRKMPTVLSQGDVRVLLCEMQGDRRQGMAMAIRLPRWFHAQPARG